MNNALINIFERCKEYAVIFNYYDMKQPLTLNELLAIFIHVYEEKTPFNHGNISHYSLQLMENMKRFDHFEKRLDTQERINGRLRELIDNQEKRIAALEQSAMPKLNDVKIQEKAKEAVDRYFKYYDGQSEWSKYIEKLKKDRPMYNTDQEQEGADCKIMTVKDDGEVQYDNPTSTANRADNNKDLKEFCKQLLSRLIALENTFGFAGQQNILAWRNRAKELGIKDLYVHD